MSQVDLEILFSEYSLRKSLKSLCLLKDQVIFLISAPPALFKANVIKLLNLPAIVWILLWIRCHSEV